MSQKSVNGSYWQTPPGSRNQILLIPTSLEERILDDHPVRLLDEILDGLDWTAWENTYNRKLGQPPIHPSILCKVLLFAMIRRVRSSRMIEYQIAHSIDFMWLVSGRSIDHSTISDFRREHKKELKDIHRQMLRTAIDMGLAKLSELCIDGTRVRANASRHKTWTADRVEKLLKELDGQIETAMVELETNDSLDDLFDDGTSPDKLPPELAELTTRRAKLNEVFQQLQEMDIKRKADGINPKKNPAQLPKSDLDSRMLPNKEGGVKTIRLCVKIRRCRWRRKMSNACPSIRSRNVLTSLRLCTMPRPIVFIVLRGRRCLGRARRLVKRRVAPCCM